jgi:hypothetical protein
MREAKGDGCMDEMIHFLGVMSALSASTQTITMQLRKRVKHLQFVESENEDETVLKKRKDVYQVNIHLIAGVVGGVLAWLGQIHPLQMLQMKPVWSVFPAWLANGFDYFVAGVLVSFGGPFFHELLGSLREYKKTLRQNK